MNVISFALWGSNPAYLVGAISNAKLAPLYYPGWQCRIYCGQDTPASWRNELQRAGYQVVMRRALRGLWDGLFWRFEPVFDPQVSVCLIRDCDSRLNPREAAAVTEWLATKKRLHTMRDHYQHIVPILGGMWGCRHWPHFGLLWNNWMAGERVGQLGQDQDFLKEAVWPLVRENDCLAHDRYTSATHVATENGPFVYDPLKFYGAHLLQPFPKHAPLSADLGEHVGARVWT